MLEDKITPIYSGNVKDFTWVGFGSGSGTNLRECAKMIKPALILCDRPKAKLADISKAKEYNLEILADVPRLNLNGYKECGSWKAIEGNDEAEVRYKRRSIKFNKKIVSELKKFEDKLGKAINLIVLGGYMRLIEFPLLEAYKDKIINVHPADLSILDGKNKRIFIGENAVYDAIKANQTSTRSSVIMVDEKTDHGEILVQGPRLNVWPEYLSGSTAESESCLEDYAKAHQSFQKVRSDWPALTKALKLISEGKIGLGSEKVHFNEWRKVFIDNKPMPYAGKDIDYNHFYR